jgi:hypothetical protein
MLLRGDPSEKRWNAGITFLGVKTWAEVTAFQFENGTACVVC